jgi:hypothetical protein
MVSKAAGIIGSLPGFNRYTRNPGDFVGLRMSERAGPSADAVRLRQMAWAAETAKTPPPRALRYNAKCCSWFRTQPQPKGRGRHFGIVALPTLARSSSPSGALNPMPRYWRQPRVAGYSVRAIVTTSDYGCVKYSMRAARSPPSQPRGLRTQRNHSLANAAFSYS